MTVQFVHPSRSKLRDWLSALAPSEKVTVHVESCERCASLLVDLADRDVDGGERVADEALLAQVVTTEWAPPADLTERVIRGIDERERNQRDLNVVLGLFGIATETASLMLPPEPRLDPALDQRASEQPETGPQPVDDPSGENDT